MLKKDIIKKLSAILAAAMIASCGTASFADTNTEPLTEEGSQTPDNTPDETPAAIDASISANYTDNEDGTYTVEFTSLTELENLKNFNFTVNVTAEGATIKSAAFSPALQEDDYSAVTTKATSVVFADGAKTTSVSGKVLLCTVTIASSVAPSKDNIELSGFTVDTEEKTGVTVTPTLIVTDEPIIPVLSDNAQAAYDMIVALPSADSLSFYTDNENKILADIEKICESITTAVGAYKALSSDEKEDIQETLAFYNKSLDGLETLKALADDMLTVADVMKFAEAINAVDENDLLNHRFLTGTYTDVVTKEIDESKLTFTDGSALKTQYEQAKTDISDKAAMIESKYSAIKNDYEGYEYKIKILDSQLEKIQKLSSDKYYEKYLADLYTQASAVLTELDSYNSVTGKPTLVTSVNNCMAKIKAIQNGVSTLPTVTFPSRINRRYKYTTTLTRTKDAAVDAEVKIVVYNEGETENEIDSETFDFEEKETEVDLEMTADSAYPSNENVDVYVYYIISGAEFLLDSETLYCRVMPSPVTSSTSQTVNNSSSNQGGSSSSSGGTRFPSASDDDEDTKNNTEETQLFNDIEKYDWAKEAIEGLYYAGIINGMEEGVFNPAGNVTREQFCKMVVQLFGVLENETESNFNDVDPNSWYASYICSAISAGYVQGQSDDYFGIGESIMRQDMATILYRAIGEQNSRAVLDFTDTDNIAPYAEDAISELVGIGVLSGYEDGSFKPRGTATRAEAAKVIWGIYNIIND